MICCTQRHTETDRDKQRQYRDTQRHTETNRDIQRHSDKYIQACMMIIANDDG